VILVFPGYDGYLDGRIFYRHFEKEELPERFEIGLAYLAMHRSLQGCLQSLGQNVTKGLLEEF
jgi:hypothetical protein